MSRPSFRTARSKGSNKGVYYYPSSVTFGLYTSSEVRSLSTVHVINPQPFNVMGHPNPKGLYDLHMGPFSERSELVCQTCFFHAEHCAGHLGHIELPVPVVNPLLYSTLLQLLKLSCVACGRFRLMEYRKELFYVQMRLLDHGLIIPAEEATRLVELSTADEATAEDGRRKRRSNRRADDALIAQRLRDFCGEEIAKAQNNDSDVSVTRSVEALRKLYRREFMGSSSGKGPCPHCSNYTKNIVHNRSRFIYEGGPLKRKSNASNEESISTRIDEADASNEELLEMLSTEEGDKSRGKKSSGSDAIIKTELTAEELRQHCRLLWEREANLLTQIFPTLNLDTANANSSGDCPIDVFFLEVLAVPPPKCRPCMYSGDSLTLHPQSTTLTHVLETSHVMRQLMKALKQERAGVSELDEKTTAVLGSVRGNSTQEKLTITWQELQGHVDRVLDREMRSGDNTKVGWGLKQLVEKKEGLLRMNMMGKRVNFAARSVITPDPFIDIDEIGVPEVFAKRLSYRVPITPWNVEQLRQMVINGPDVHPGAVCIEYENGLRRMLDKQNDTQRLALAKMLLTPSSSDDEGMKFVYRHLLNGDPMLLNRQPTLHKPSIMAHKARILKGQKVMRLHYAVCKSYNADFDGDEMNAHFPQNEVAKSEAHNIANVCQQYLVPKDGSPLQGLIQDHIISGVKMTIRGRFFEREEYQQLLMGALVHQRHQIRLLPPSILKPKQLWSGKQIISTIILNIVNEDHEKSIVGRGKKSKLPSLTSSSKVKSSAFASSTPRVPSANMEDTEVIIRQGEMLSGLLDKNAFGATSYGLVHCLHELYGGEMSAKMLSCLSKLFTHFLQREGFTLGVKDIVVTQAANDKRRKIMRQTRRAGKELAAKGVGMNFEHIDDIDDDDLRRRLESHHRRSAKQPQLRAEVDRAYKQYLDEANNAMNSACVPKGLEVKFPRNNLQLMVQAGAKGSSVNTMQISGLLGQIALEGKRPPLMISGRSLPSFRPYDFRPVSGGFIDGRFMSGIRPQEFFFHCMAGREGLIDTAVKTSRSGYLQRCLIKILEGLRVHYDKTVRDSDNSVIQFQYGEDGLDVCKSQFIKKQALPLLAQNSQLIMKKSVLNRMKAINTDAQIEKMQKLKNKLTKQRVKFGDVRSKSERSSPFLRFCKTVNNEERRLFNNDQQSVNEQREELVQKWRDLSDEQRKNYARKSRSKIGQTVTNSFRPDNHFGSVSEAVEKLIESYNSEEGQKQKLKNKKDLNIDELVYMKFMSALVEPGEPVGVLAAQSIGEPSTQMTLNTFHFAGRGEMNVTLGIPRLREILMVASDNIKTPMVRIPFSSTTDSRGRDFFRKSLNKATLADVLASVKVSESLSLNGSNRYRQVKMRFEFLPRAAYRDRFNLRPKDILEVFEEHYVARVLLPSLRNCSKTSTDSIRLHTENKFLRKGGRPKANNREGDNEDNNEPGMTNNEQAVSSDEEQLPDDADATETRKHQRQNDADDEEEFSEEELELIKAINKRMGEAVNNEEENTNNDSTKVEGGIEEQVDEGFTELENEEGNSDIDDPATSQLNRNASDASESADRSALMEEDDEVKERRAFVMNVGNSASVQVSNYEYDTSKELWCELTLRFPLHLRLSDLSNLVRKSAERSVVCAVPNINRAFVNKADNSDTFELTTEGINIEAITARPDARACLDLDQIYCNNIHEVARRYGIEAAGRTIVGEMRNVFRVYGIEVDLRHLTLIADFMTFDGSYKPFNRFGIENNPSPLQQMTFETAIGFMRQATLCAKKDNLDSPSARIVLGQPCKGGTTAFELVQKLVENCDQDVKEEQE